MEMELDWHKEKFLSLNSCATYEFIHRVEINSKEEKKKRMSSKGILNYPIGGIEIFLIGNNLLRINFIKRSAMFKNRLAPLSLSRAFFEPLRSA